MKKVLLINGPNLNLLGTREPQHYGNQTLDAIVSSLTEYARSENIQLEHIQSNAEHELINAVHNTDADFVIINPAAFTHTSAALRDALTGVKLPFVEVHLSNVHSREPFRRHSYFSDIAIGVIFGLGANGYRYALEFAIQELRTAD